MGNGKSRLAWKNAKLAMAVYGKNRPDRLATIVRRHFNATAVRCGWGEYAEGVVNSIRSGDALHQQVGAIFVVACTEQFNPPTA